MGFSNWRWPKRSTYLSISSYTWGTWEKRGQRTTGPKGPISKFGCSEREEKRVPSGAFRSYFGSLIRNIATGKTLWTSLFVSQSPPLLTTHPEKEKLTLTMTPSPCKETKLKAAAPLCSYWLCPWGMGSRFSRSPVYSRLRSPDYLSGDKSFHIPSTVYQDQRGNADC